MNFMFPPKLRPYVPIVGQGVVFPVNRVYCVGRNFAAHAIEMGHDPDKEPPFFFQKNPDNILADGNEFPYPPASNDVHHEIEMFVALGSGGANIPQQAARDCIFGYGVALDMTRRDLQGQMKKAGRPWEIGKAFEQSAPCGPIYPAADVGHPEHGAIWLNVNGETRQQGDLDQLIWKVPELISYLSDLFTLSAGDIILTGTPAGVGPVARGDQMQGGIDGLGTINIRVT